MDIVSFNLTILKSIFWGASFLVIYPYLVYPLLLYIFGKQKRAPVYPPLNDEKLPSITLLISAFNEESVIEKKLKNSLNLEYPDHRLDILVVSDCSDDRTDELVSSWAQRHPQISLFRQDSRLGKSSGITAAMENILTDIVVFSDANAIYDPSAIRKLIEPFHDPEVGYVVGSALYLDSDSDAVKDSEGLYWKYELWVKALESNYESVVGGDGAIYAIRRSLFQPLNKEDINDFVNPLQIVASGFKGRFCADARCYEYASDEFSKEFGRKRRIVNRSWRGVRSYLHLFDRYQHAKFLFMLFSHKVIRWLSLVFVAIALVSCCLILMLDYSGLYVLALSGILASILFAAIGKWQDTQGKQSGRIFYIPYYFYFVSLASLLGIWDNARGVQHITWGHIRS